MAQEEGFKAQTQKNAKEDALAAPKIDEINSNQLITVLACFRVK
jgi:hypothetical protein